MGGCKFTECSIGIHMNIFSAVGGGKILEGKNGIQGVFMVKTKW